MDLDFVLQGVVAYVEVRSNNDNRSAAICQALKQLGARVESSFSDNVTHVVFKEGMKRTWSKALKRGIPLVAVHWIDSCKQNQKCMPIKDFPAILPEENNSPILKLNQNTRWKKMKSMQPCDFDEEMARSAERNEMRRKRVMMANRFKLTEEATPSSTPAPILALETQYRSPLYLPLSKSSSPVPDTPPSLKERLERMRREQKLLLGTEEDSPTVTTKPQVDKPLQRRLFDKLASGLGSTEESSDEETTAHVVSKLIQKLESDNSQSPSGKTKSACPDELPANKCAGDSGGSSIAPESLGTSTNTPSTRKRRSLRVSKEFQISRNETGQDTAIDNRVDVLRQTSTKNKMSSDNENSDPLVQYDLAVKSHKGRRSASRALSPQNVNADVPKACNHEAVGDNANIASKEKISGREQSKQIFSYHSKCHISENGKTESMENLNAKPREGRVALKKTVGESHSCESKNAGTADNTANILKPKLTKKKRNLFTESAVPTLVDLPSRTAQKFSPEAPPSSKSAGRAATAQEAKSDVSFLFGNAEPRDTQCQGNNTRRKSRRLSSMPCHTAESNNGKQTETEPNKGLDSKSGDKLKSGKAGIISQKQMTSNFADSVLKNDTLGTSMSIMYGNDTTMAKSHTIDSRRSIDEFAVNNMAKKKKTRAVAEQRTDSKSRTEETDSRLQQKSMNKQAHGKQKKRHRSNSESSETALPTDLPRSKKHKGFSSNSQSVDEILNTSSAAQEEEIAPTRLRHARSLVMEQTILSYSKKSRYSLVMTSLHRDEQDLVYSVVKKLGVFHMTNNVESSTTHVVCGEPRRTLNVLKAVARGCWLLRKEWILESLEAGAWLLEEDFEMHEFPTAKKSRLGRQNIGTQYKLDLLSNMGPIFVSSASTPPRPELVHLINLCCGHVTGSEQRAAVHIGDQHSPTKLIIKPTWILDSVMKMQLLPAADYIVPSPVSQSQRENSPEF